MAEVLSIASASLGMIDICVRLGKFVKELDDASGEIQEDIKTLKAELLAFQKVFTSIKDVATKSSTRITTEGAGDVDALWEAISKTQDECKSCLLKFEEHIKTIVGNNENYQSSAWKDKVDRVKKAYRKQSREATFTELRRSLANHQCSLQISFTAINLHVLLQARDTTEGNISNLSDKITEMGFSLQQQIAYLPLSANDDKNHDFWASISCATQLANDVDLNVHFRLPRVRRNYIGRKQQLYDLTKFYHESVYRKDNDNQMCFVVQGLGGSGKTEFCYKFAKDNKRLFWGVFRIDASSQERAKASFEEIANLSGRNGDVASAKDWLSSSALSRPWLLVVDNADDETLDIDQYIPSGKRGLILITTRNPALRNMGTLGCGYYHFETLESGEANELLLVESGNQPPWEPSVVQAADKVARALGFLPLALVHAGKVILNGLCRLADYILYHEQMKKRIREEWIMQGVSQKHAINIDVYSSYDLLFKNLEDSTESGIDSSEKDAIDLLRIFSFFYYDNLSVKVLVRAAMNSVKEQSTGKLMLPRSWQMLRELGFKLQQKVLEDQSVPNLPRVLCLVEPSTETFDGFRVRLNAALAELSKRSLITLRSDPNAENWTYSMHPLVHEWVRLRPQMTRRQQAVCCQEAITILTQTILLPPLELGSDRERFYRELLPHIIFAQNCEKEINEGFKSQLARRGYLKNLLFPLLKKRIGQKEAIGSAKFGFVYLQCGHFNKAVEHLLLVRQYLLPLGLENEKNRQVTLSLSGAYVSMGAVSRGEKLQREILAACEKSFGQDDLRTLELMDKLALTLGIQGWYPEALELQQRAIDAMVRREDLGPDHRHTLSVVDHQGETLWKLFRFEEAIKLHESALCGLVRESPLGFGPNSTRTLEVKTNLAKALLELSREKSIDIYATRAHKIMTGVLAQRQNLLGKEHPDTLVAAGLLAQAKSELNDFATAEAIFEEHIAIADRTIGANHFGVIGHGRFRLAQCLLRQKKYAAAEALFLDVIERYDTETKRLEVTSDESPRGNHPDYIYYQYNLMECYQQQGNLSLAMKICHELCASLQDSPHPIKKRVLLVHEELLHYEYLSNDV